MEKERMGGKGRQGEARGGKGRQGEARGDDDILEFKGVDLLAPAELGFALKMFVLLTWRGTGGLVEIALVVAVTDGCVVRGFVDCSFDISAGFETVAFVGMVFVGVLGVVCGIVVFVVFVVWGIDFAVDDDVDFVVSIVEFVFVVL